MKVYIVAEVEPAEGEIENDYVVADSLAQTLGGECGTMLFDVEEPYGETGFRQAVYRLTKIGAYPGDVPDLTDQEVLYPVDELSGEVEGGYMPAKRWQPPKSAGGT